MKKNLLLLIAPLALVAANTTMPPMPPMIPGIDTTPKSPSASSTLPKSCEIIPPMIYKLPPPLENALTTCKNDMYSPNDDAIKAKFGKTIKDIKVEALKDFSQVYKIQYLAEKKTVVKYCNKNLSFCFETSPKKQ